MENTDAHDVTRELREMQELLSRAAEEVGEVVDAAEGRPRTRFRRRTAMQVLNCIVKVDMQLAEVHTRRQRILERESERTSFQN